MNLFRALIKPACAAVFLMLAVPASHAQTLTTLFSYPGVTDGQSPQANVIVVGDFFYGVTSGGGNWNNGTIFKINRTTGVEAPVYAFTGGNDGAVPVGGLVNVNGVLYGTTSAGGQGGHGVLFAYDTGTGQETSLHSFEGKLKGSTPIATLLNVNGTLFGTTVGDVNGLGSSLFEFDIARRKFTTLAVPGGAEFASSLIPVGGLLYGTWGNGIFSFDVGSGVVTPYTFTSGGFYASGPVVDVNGTLYGLSIRGGQWNCGAVYSFNPSTGAFAVVYNFTGGEDGYNPGGPLLAIGGALYGTASEGGAWDAGAVFRVDAQTGREVTIYSINPDTDGVAPGGGVIDVGGKFYATVSASSLLSIDAKTDIGKPLHVFEGQDYHSNSPFIAFDGQLYGVSNQGGPKDDGIVVRINPRAAGGRVVYAFGGGTDGTSPLGGLVAFGGKLYGTTASAVPFNYGTVFRFDPVTDGEAPLCSFAGGADGAFPATQMSILNGLLTGIVPYGGVANGFIFRVDPQTGARKTLFDFGTLGFVDGDLNAASRLLVRGNSLFGVRHGLFYNTGILYKVDLGSGAGEVVHNFAGWPGDARYPYGSLVWAGDLLYGTAFGEGATAYGAVYAVNPATQSETLVYSFLGGADGAFPWGGLTPLNGLLYGTTFYGGTYGQGSLFSLNPATRVKTTLYSFTGKTDGSNPSATLFSLGGALYGTTDYGGTNNRGAAFQFVP